MNRTVCLGAAVLFWAHLGIAQQSAEHQQKDEAERQRVMRALGFTPEREHAAEVEQKREMHVLGITALRPGVSQKPGDANPVNYDDAKAALSSPLPDPLRFNDGGRVRTVQDWQKRRAEIVEIFDREIFGRVPANVPAVTWSVAKTERGVEDFTDGNGAAQHIAFVRKHLIGHVNNSSDPGIKVDIVLDLTIPEKRQGKVPVEMEFSWMFQFPKGLPRIAGAEPPGPTWQQQVLARGWGYAELSPTSIQGDSGADLQQGIIGLANQGKPREMDQWGALRAWAWGASRAMDYLETDDALDAKRVGIDGHSRYGKAALVTMAYDARFRVAYVSSSGAGGTALWRRNFGEQIGNVSAANEFHWMAGNFLKYSAEPLHTSDLPVDMHELIALCAPRHVFVGAGAAQGDKWADAKGEFLAEVAATPVYHLFGEQGIESPVFPPVGEAVVAGALGFRQHELGHTQAPNWPVYLDFAEKAFR
ncbi:MAG TPA: hypothetical protein VH351_22695 [Bryobacteraceae bacterium]|jgi:hypothetical protein|nr:hypothetical protein [Bryobacteraceae bacterium]